MANVTNYCFSRHAAADSLSTTHKDFAFFKYLLDKYIMINELKITSYFPFYCKN